MAERPARAERRDTVGAVEHAIFLLRCLSGAGAPLGINEIARQLGLHKSSVSRLATTLERARLVQRDPSTGRVALGMGLVALAAPVLADFSMLRIVKPMMQRLAAELGETVSFSVWDGQEAVSIEQVPGPNPVAAFSPPGHRNPGHATAAGKVLLAHMGQEAIEAYCRAPLHRFTEATVTAPAVLAAELAKCRAQGLAVNTGEFERDVGAISAIVCDREGLPLGAVTATVPMYRFGRARRLELARVMVGFSAELARHIGAPVRPSKPS